MHHLHLRIQGRVQGVGFRHYILRQARSLGLRGTVRNLPDGAVEVEAEGELPPLSELLDRARRGPPASVVNEVVTQWGEGPARHDDFRIRP